jgi:hypothetical protein
MRARQKLKARPYKAEMGVRPTLPLPGKDILERERTMATRQDRAEAIVEALEDLIQAKIDHDRANRTDPEWACGIGVYNARHFLIDRLVEL